MDKKEETEEVEEEVKEEVKEKVEEEIKEEVVQKPVMLGQIPTEYGLIYQTPDGIFKTEEYLAWIGNEIIKIREALTG